MKANPDRQLKELLSQTSASKSLKRLCALLSISFTLQGCQLIRTPPQQTVRQSPSSVYANCQVVNPDQSLHTFRVCLDHERIDFTFQKPFSVPFQAHPQNASHSQHYARQEGQADSFTRLGFDFSKYRHTLKKKIFHWLFQNGMSEKALWTARIQYWTYLPAFDPSRPSLRVVVQSIQGHKGFVAPLDLRNWQPNAKNTFILGYGRYPNQHGYQIGQLELRLRTQLDPAQWQKVLQHKAAQPPTREHVWEQTAANTYRLHTAPLNEWATAKSLIEQSSLHDFVSSVNLIPFDEPSGYYRLFHSERMFTSAGE